jgi:hypothetical protein
MQKDSQDPTRRALYSTFEEAVAAQSARPELLRAGHAAPIETPRTDIDGVIRHDPKPYQNQGAAERLSRYDSDGSVIPASAQETCEMKRAREYGIDDAALQPPAQTPFELDDVRQSFEPWLHPKLLRMAAVLYIAAAVVLFAYAMSL